MENYHAYIVEGEAEMLFPHLRTFCEKTFGIKTNGNPDYIELKYVQCGVNDARTITSLQEQKALGSSRVIVCSFMSMTTEAQNSLLKTLEEPTPGVCIILAPRSKESLIPTVRSRMRPLPLSRAIGFSDEVLTVASSFKDASLGSRLKMIQEMLGSLEKGKGTKDDILSFVQALEVVYSRNTPRDWDAIKRIRITLTYLYDRTQSVKQLLEYLAHTL
ncbi:MAG: hypothetical protein WDZ88_01030 [Candidatus Paceibacterota bacterium]